MAKRLQQTKDELMVALGARAWQNAQRNCRPSVFRTAAPRAASTGPYDDSAACDYSGDEVDPPPQQRPDDRDREHRLRRQEENFRHVLPSWVDTGVAFAPQHAAQRASAWEREVAERQADADAWAEHPYLACHGVSDQHTVSEGSKHVVYRGIAASGVLTVHQAKCGICGVFYDMPAAAAGCTASSPVNESIWFSNELLTLRHAFQMNGVGVSNAQFCTAIDAFVSVFDSMSCGPCNTLLLDEEHLSTALRYWRAVYRRKTDPETHGAEDVWGGAVAYCPICRKVPGGCKAGSHACTHADADAGPAPEATHAAAGNTTDSTAAQSSHAADFWAEAAGVQSAEQRQGGAADPQQCPQHPMRPFTVSADANVKAGHFASRGTAGTAAWQGNSQRPELEPLSEQFLGRADRRYPSARMEYEGESAADRAAVAESAATCGAQLACARTDAASNGKAVTDRKCLAGSTCTHGVPVRGTFIRSPVPERFSIYILIVCMLAFRKDPQHGVLAAFLLDINCQFGPHMQRLVPQLADGIQFLNGWLHSRAGHALRCQLRFSSLYAEGLGRCIGENTEQLWAMLKNLAGQLRYMSLPHHQETLEDFLLDFSQDEFFRSVELLLEHVKHVAVREKQLRQELTDVEGEASKHDWQLGTSQFSAPDAAGPADPRQKYVQLLSEQILYDSLRANGGAYIAAMGSKASGEIVEKAQSAADAARRESAIVRLETQLGITVRWTPDCNEFQAVAADLRATRIAEVQLDIETKVSELVTLQKQQQGQLGRAAGKLSNAVSARRRALRELGARWQAWHVFSQPCEYQPPDAPTVSDLVAGRFQWVPALAPGAVHREQLELRHHRIQAELARTREEQQYLPGDAYNMVCVFSFQRAALGQAIEGASPASVPLGQAKLAAGRRFLLFALQERIAVLESEARAAYRSITGLDFV